MMRTFVIAFGLAGLYTLLAPAGQSLWINLAAGALCMAVAIAVTGSDKAPKAAVMIYGVIALVLPYVALLAGIGFLAQGMALYARGPETATLGGAEVVSALDVTLPLVFCLTGVVLFFASAGFLYLRSRGQR